MSDPSNARHATATPLLAETQLDTDDMPWAPFPGIRGGGFKLLRVHPDTGGYTALLWIPPGTRGPLHKHTAAVEYLILQGHVDFGDRVLGPGCYFYEPAGLTHSEPPPDEDVVMLVTSFGPIATTRADGSPGPIVDADLLAGFYDRAVTDGGVVGGPSLRSGK
jgi:hypothetical protein